MPKASEGLRKAFDTAVLKREVPVNSVMRRLYNCSDVVPADVCSILGLPTASTYAKAVRSWRRWESSVNSQFSGEARVKRNYQDFFYRYADK